MGVLVVIEESHITFGMEHQADNSWNLLHIASQIFAAYVAHHGRGTPESIAQAAKDSLTAADALLAAWRNTQGDER